MKFEYYINHSQKYILEVWPEEFTYNEYKEFKEHELKDPEYNSNYNIISDLRKLTMNFDEGMTDKIIKLISSFPNYFRKRKSAIITNSPKQVANSLIYAKKIKDQPVYVNIFSTIEAAYKWLEKTESEPELTFPGKML